MRIFANYEKGEAVRFISHLDMQRLFQRAFRRAQVPLAYSQGFNPHPLLSFASALAVGYTGESEWLDVRLERPMELDAFKNAVNAMLPDGVYIKQALEAPQETPTLTALTASALYEVRVFLKTPLATAVLQQGIETLLNGEIIVKKKTKGGDKMVDIRPQLLSMEMTETDADVLLRIMGLMNVYGALHVGLLMEKLVETWNVQGTWRVHRKEIFFEKTGVLPL